MSFEASIVSICKSNPKLLYNYVNSQKKCQSIIRSSLDEIADVLNHQFCKVFNPSLSSCIVEPLKLTVIDVIDNNAFSYSKVLSAINKLNLRKSPGPDGLHPLFVYNCATSFAQHLSHIFSNSFISGITPTRWKHENITPAFKKGSRIDPANYRSISLTALPCKIIEKIIRDLMMIHLTNNNFNNEAQNGFVPNKSCMTNLLETVDVITNALDSRNRVVIFFILIF